MKRQEILEEFERVAADLVRRSGIRCCSDGDKRRVKIGGRLGSKVWVTRLRSTQFFGRDFYTTFSVMI
jgi:hypothetical protein